MIYALVLATSASELAIKPEVDERHEIVVTGERVSRKLHETASSVLVETGETIDSQASPDRIEQLLQAIPNVQLGTGGEGPTIRGQDSTGVVPDLPAFLSGSRPRTTIQIDGRSATYYELAFGLTSVWDVERLEVFRSRSEEHTSELQSLMRISYAVFCLKKKNTIIHINKLTE